MLNCFKKDYSGHGEGGVFLPKWGIIIPHRYEAQGAKSDLHNITEYSYALDLAITLRTKFTFATRDSDGVKGAVGKLLRESVHTINATLEPHLNAFNTKAKGFEILVLKGDKLSQDYAEKIAEEFKRAYPERNLRHGNGVKIITKGDRGYKNLKAAKNAGIKVALLSEAFFLDNPEDWIKPTEMAKFWGEVLV